VGAHDTHPAVRLPSASGRRAGASGGFQGAGSGIRTRTRFRAMAFEAIMSASSITPA
jgi:hypothetical protein